jgi:hypothetical protein
VAHNAADPNIAAQTASAAENIAFLLITSLLLITDK